MEGAASSIRPTAGRVEVGLVLAGGRLEVAQHPVHVDRLAAIVGRTSPPAEPVAPARRDPVPVLVAVQVAAHVHRAIARELKPDGERSLCGRSAGSRRRVRRCGSRRGCASTGRSGTWPATGSRAGRSRTLGEGGALVSEQRFALGMSGTWRTAWSSVITTTTFGGGERGAPGRPARPARRRRSAGGGHRDSNTWAAHVLRHYSSPALAPVGRHLVDDLARRSSGAASRIARTARRPWRGAVDVVAHPQASGGGSPVTGVCTSPAPSSGSSRSPSGRCGCGQAVPARPPPTAR